MSVQFTLTGSVSGFAEIVDILVNEVSDKVHDAMGHDLELGEVMIQQLLLDSTTRTGEERKAAGGFSAGRYDEGTMYASVFSTVSEPVSGDEGDVVIAGEFGIPERDYFPIQIKGGDVFDPELNKVVHVPGVDEQDGAPYSALQEQVKDIVEEDLQRILGSYS